MHEGSLSMNKEITDAKKSTQQGTISLLIGLEGTSGYDPLEILKQRLHERLNSELPMRDSFNEEIQEE